MKILTIVILATFLIGGCTTKQELSREEAANMIKESMKYPRVIDYDIYTSDPEFAKMTIDKGLEKEGLVTVQRTQSLVHLVQRRISNSNQTA